MVRPCASSSRNVCQLAQAGTSMALEMRTRGAAACVLKTATGLPDCTSSVSSSLSRRKVRTIASNASHERAARPLPPYTTRSCGRSATSGSRLFMSMRMAASCPHPRQVRFEPRGARTTRAADTELIRSERSELALDRVDERAGANELHGRGDVSAQLAVTIQVRDALAQQPMRDGGAVAERQRAAKIERLCRHEQFDRDDGLVVLDDRGAVPRRDRAHAVVVFLTSGGRDRIDGRGRGEHLVLAHERGSGVLRKHVAAAQAEALGQERG